MTDTENIRTKKTSVECKKDGFVTFAHAQSKTYFMLLAHICVLLRNS